MTTTRVISSPRRAGAEPAAAPGLAGRIEAATAPALVTLFLATVIIPVFLYVGGLTLTLSRLLLLVLAVPLFVRLVSGKAGRLLMADYFFMLYAFWILVSLTYNHGTSRIALSGITIIEHFGAYLLGRTLIRNVTDFRHYLRVLFITMLILFPAAVIELNTNINLWTDLWGTVFDVARKGGSAYGRMGLERVQSGFEHPIHFGMYCALGVANFFYLYRNQLAKALPMMGFSTFMSFMSLSSGPLLAIALQVILILWDQITRGKWKLFVILCVIGYVTIDALSNRTPVTILISTLTFNSGSAWTRIGIWEFGMINVWRSPIFGIGLNDWIRPFWLTSSVDNFWLLTMMRHGIVALVFLGCGIVLGLRDIVRTKGLDEEQTLIRTGYVISVAALLFSLSTVHIWGAAGSYVMFYFGAGLWLCSAGKEGAPESNPEAETGQDMPRRAHMSGRAIPAAPDPGFPRPAPTPREAGRELPQSRFAHVHRREDRKG
ncbi:O-antigen ligase family protein [Tabrizicola sp. J26]|uniref:O-antigen ligase family protein n=1 Tax=Alitabrizicola rongguiensis TaxID=2909234 RepID=UPI001F26C13C|nr:O-antigen ligase family protein [Tabrizicola rongguiensis]MCF1711091.1 O-antigen ligase family protein [Tabrizicola rongguiensis]